MPERLNRVQIQTHRGVGAIPWQSRDQLLHQIRDLEDAGPVVAEFENAGALRPIDLDDNGKRLIARAIEVMWSNLGGPPNLPEGLFDLWRQLTRDVLDDSHEAREADPEQLR